MARVAGWQALLVAYIREAEERYKAEGFSYGAFDCVHFAGDWVLRCTGDDPLADYRGAYSTQDEALAVLAEKDGSLYEALVKRFGQPIPVAKAHRGDIAYAEGIHALGIFFSAGAKTQALFLSEGGFALHSLRELRRVDTITHAFKVGRE